MSARELLCLTFAQKESHALQRGVWGISYENRSMGVSPMLTGIKVSRARRPCYDKGAFSSNFWVAQSAMKALSKIRSVFNPVEHCGVRAAVLPLCFA